MYGAFVTVIAPVVPLFVPFHRLEMVWPLASVSFTVQLLIADEPAVTLTLPLKPPVQLLDVVYDAEQVPEPPAGAVLGGAVVGVDVVGVDDGGVVVPEVTVMLELPLLW